jgi:SNF2 family DNA or RNA helicase
MEYFVPNRDGFNWDLVDGSEERIYRKLSPLVLSMAADDYLDLPKEVVNDIFVDLPPAARKIYDEVERDLISALESGEVVAANAAVASGKCRQVASGGVYLTPDVTELIKLKRGQRDYAFIHHEKTDALVDLIDELQGSPILVAYDFGHDLTRIRERLGDVPYIGGGVSVKRGRELEKLWNAGKLPYLFAHPASIAHGLNLQDAGNHVAWYTLTWNYEDYDQFIKRVLRQGNDSKHVFVHRFLARDTVDEYAVAPSLLRKRNGQNALFSGLKDLQRRRARQPARA